jgi:mitogen-activated protein kinase organizer 1
VVDVEVNFDNTQIASCGGDKTPYIWNSETGIVIRKFRGHDQRINCLAFNEECTLLMTGSYDRTTKIWDLRSRSYDPIQTLDDPVDSVESICVSKHEIITGSIDGSVRTYDIRAGRLKVDTVNRPISCITLSHDQNIILASNLDSTLRLIDKEDGTLYNEYRGHINTEYPVKNCFSNNDTYVMSGSEDGNIFFWQLEDAKLIRSIHVHNGRVSGLTSHPTKQYLLSSSTDTIKILGTPGDEDLTDGKSFI